MDILEVSEARVKLANLEKQIASGELSLFDRCEVEDEILELREQIGDFERQVREEGNDCINCSG